MPKTLAFLPIFILCMTTIMGCGHTTKLQSKNSDDTRPTFRSETPALEEGYAKLRKQQISDVSYHLDVDLTGKIQFKGTTTLNFEFHDVGSSPLTIDFDSGEILEAQLNGQSIETQYERWFITIPSTNLKPGRNALTIRYQKPYSNTGNGLHQYIDAKTQRRYVYTNFEPYNANKLFPHFDQPNIKATYNLKVKAPSDWEVISARRESNTTQNATHTEWKFPETLAFSSYLFPLHAGPYVKWESDGKIPLRLFARPEIQDKINTEDWFPYTKQLFAFFETYYDSPYPFEKYDQIVVPEFNAGAMENVGAVTFNESLIRSKNKTQEETLTLTYVIAHEMAHMWFGNLVTMDWWDDLWLNESFATYMGMLAVAEATDIEGVWDVFYTKGKRGAYHADQLPTTHPVSMPINTTAEAFANFDRITYSKGASILKQLPFYIGDEAFRAGIANYLTNHSYDNARFEDFIRSLEASSAQDLSSWSDKWLKSAGLNTIQAEFRCKHETLTSLKLRQSAPQEHPTLREQKVKISLIAFDKTGQANETVFTAKYAGKSTAIKVPNNHACPDLVYPNVQDMGYVKVLLDSKSQNTLRSHLHAVDNDLLRTMLWDSVWDGVLDFETPILKYIDFVSANIEKETNLKSINRISSNMIRAYSFISRLEVSNPENAKDYRNARRNIEKLFLSLLQNAAPGSDEQKHHFKNWVKVSHTAPPLDQIADILTRENAIETIDLDRLDIKGLDIDQNLRWQMLLTLNKHGHQKAKTLTENERQRDKSNQGKLMALASQSVRPDERQKRQDLTSFIDPLSTRNLNDNRTIIQHLFPSSQLQLQKQLLDTIIEIGEKAKDLQPEMFMSQYSRLFLGYCSQKSIDKITRYIEALDKKHVALLKGLRAANHENVTCVTLGKSHEQ